MHTRCPCRSPAVTSPFELSQRAQREARYGKPESGPVLDREERATQRLQRCYTPAFMGNVLSSEKKRAEKRRHEQNEAWLSAKLNAQTALREAERDRLANMFVLPEEKLEAKRRERRSATSLGFAGPPPARSGALTSPIARLSTSHGDQGNMDHTQPLALRRESQLSATVPPSTAQNQPRHRTSNRVTLSRSQRPPGTAGSNPQRRASATPSLPLAAWKLDEQPPAEEEGSEVSAMSAPFAPPKVQSLTLTLTLTLTRTDLNPNPN